MTTNHTPGPWYVNCDQGEWYVHANHHRPAANTVAGNGESLTLADAILIAAAPDMLAALIELVDEADLGEIDHDDDTIAMLNRARAAIEAAIFYRARAAHTEDQS